MRRVRSKRNKSTELRLIAIFREKGLKGWRRNYPLIGKPDFVFPEFKIALFADGCFWHGHNCRNTHPKQNASFWEEKRERNIKRDQEVTAKLIQKGWLVIRVWECEIQKGIFEDRLFNILLDFQRFRSENTEAFPDLNETD